MSKGREVYPCQQNEIYYSVTIKVAQHSCNIHSLLGRKY